MPHQDGAGMSSNTMHDYLLLLGERAAVEGGAARGAQPLILMMLRATLSAACITPPAGCRDVNPRRVLPGGRPRVGRWLGCHTRTSDILS
jgi:hypothetical protein